MGAILAGVTGCSGGGASFCTSSEDCGGGACDNGVCREPLTPVVSWITPQAGPMGTTVIITGDRFSPTREENQMTFGTAAAVITRASETALEVTAPEAGEDAVSVSVTVSGRTAENRPVFTYRTAADCLWMEAAFDSTSIVIGGNVKYQLTVHNDCGQERTELSLQGWAVQDTTRRAAGGSVLLCAVPGLAPVGDCVMRMPFGVSNYNRGSGTFSQGAASAVIELLDAKNSVVLSLTTPLTLTR